MLCRMPAPGRFQPPEFCEVECRLITHSGHSVPLRFVRMKVKTYRLLFLGLCLICATPTFAESVCYKETEINDHFESLEIGYARISEDSVLINVSVWNIENSVNVHSQVYYGLDPEAPERPELQDGFEIRVELLPEFNEDNVHFTFELSSDFSRLMIEVSSAKETEHAMMSCGIYHVLSISSDDLDRSARYGDLGPPNRAEPAD